MLNRRLPRLLFLGLTTLWCGCVDTPVDPSQRYEKGPFKPCDVVYDGSQGDYDDPGLPEDRADPFATNPPSYWLPGPFPVWNTSPDTACTDDPTIPTIGERKIHHDDGSTETVSLDDVRMYMTYPARSVPTRTGDGRVAEGKFPVIIFAHANHDRQCNIYRGYYSLHDHWASWGFVVVAIDGTVLDCSPGTKQNIELRSAGQIAAIDTLKEMNDDPDSRFYHHLDMDRLVFAGHSRGGGAALVSLRQHPDVAGVIDMEGVDLTAFGFGKATLPDVPVVGLTAGEDVDLNYPHCEPTEDMLGGEYTWVNVNGGIHAFTADGSPLEHDDEPLITRQQQHDIDEYYSTAFLARVVGVPHDMSDTFHEDPAESILFSHQSASTVNDEISSLGVFTRWRTKRDALWVDDFDSPIANNPEDENLLGGDNVSEGFATSRETSTYKPDKNTRTGMYSKSYARQLVVTNGTGTYTTYLASDRSRVDVGDYASLDLRIKGPDDGTASSLKIALVTPDGTHDVYAGDYDGPEQLSNRFTQVHIPLSELGSPDMVTAVKFTLGTGELFVDDLRFVAGGEASD